MQYLSIFKIIQSHSTFNLRMSQFFLLFDVCFFWWEIHQLAISGSRTALQAFRECLLQSASLLQAKAFFASVQATCYPQQIIGYTPRYMIQWYTYVYHSVAVYHYLTGYPLWSFGVLLILLRKDCESWSSQDSNTKNTWYHEGSWLVVFSCNCDAGYANFSLQINMFQFLVANDGWIRFLMKERNCRGLLLRGEGSCWRIFVDSVQRWEVPGNLALTVAIGL